MTTEELIAFLQQHPGEDVGVRVRCGTEMEHCDLDRLVFFAGMRPRVLLEVRVELRIDEHSLCRAVEDAVVLSGTRGQSAQ